MLASVRRSSVNADNDLLLCSDVSSELQQYNQTPHHTGDIPVITYFLLSTDSGYMPASQHNGFCMVTCHNHDGKWRRERRGNLRHKDTLTYSPSRKARFARVSRTSASLAFLGPLFAVASSTPYFPQLRPFPLLQHFPARPNPSFSAPKQDQKTRSPDPQIPRGRNTESWFLVSAPKTRLFAYR